VIDRNILGKNLRGQKFLFLIIGFVIVCTLFLPFATANLWWREALNSAHVVLFFFISFVLYFLFSTRSFFSNKLVTYFAVLVAGLVIGVVIEILQGFVQREASVDDLYRNFWGMASGLSFVALTQQKVLRSKILAAIFSFGFLLFGIAPLFQISWDYLQRDKIFPFITAFEEKEFARFLRFNHAALLTGNVVMRDSKKLHRIRFDQGKYPGLAIIEPERNWSAYHKLRFQVFSDNTSNTRLVLKIYDEKHNQNYSDRFNQHFIIRPGLNEIIVSLIQIRDAPVGRKLDLTKISGVQLFLTNVTTPLFLELSDFILEK